MGALAAHGIDPNPSFLRTSDGYEIDLVLRASATTVAIEVKLAASVAPQDLARLERAADLIGAEHRYVVCQTAAPIADARRGVLTLETLIERLLRIARTR